MRGYDQQQDGMFSNISPNKRVPQDHPLRMIRTLVDGVLEQLSPRFNKVYARVGRLSITPEKLGSRPATANSCRDSRALGTSRLPQRGRKGEHARRPEDYNKSEIAGC
jgi:hypothetical protein